MTHEELTEMRQYYLAAPLVRPMIQKFRDDALARLLAKHRDGDSRYDTIVAELAVLRKFEIEFEQRENIYKTLEERSNVRK